MLNFRVICREDYRRSTWKNGLGYTDEIAIHPETAQLRAGDFLWRVSSARIEQSSPFSPFPEHDRVLVILKGKGVRLTHAFEGDEESVEIPPLQPYDFPGDVPSRCELIEGPITDLSVFIRKAEAEAITESRELAAVATEEWLPAGRWNFAFAAQGGFSAQIPGLGSLYVNEGETLRLDLDAPLEEGVVLQTGASGAQVVLIGIQG